MEYIDSEKSYEAPTLRVIGTLADMTLGGHNQPFLDASFAAGTPVSQITTS